MLSQNDAGKTGPTRLQCNGILSWSPNMSLKYFSWSKANSQNTDWYCQMYLMLISLILKAWVKATGLLLGSCRRFTSHPKGFFSPKLHGGEYQLISSRVFAVWTIGPCDSRWVSLLWHPTKFWKELEILLTCKVPRGLALSASVCSLKPTRTLCYQTLDFQL